MTRNVNAHLALAVAEITHYQITALTPHTHKGIHPVVVQPRIIHVYIHQVIKPAADKSLVRSQGKHPLIQSPQPGSLAINKP